MHRSLLKSTAAVIVAAAIGSCAWADGPAVLPPAGRWNKVESLAQGTPVAVELKQGDRLRAAFVRLEADSILLRLETAERAYSKESVAEVAVLHPNSRQRKALIGLGVGFGVGFGMGIMGAHITVSKPSAGYIAGQGIGLGALVGALGAGIASIPKPRERRQVVYYAK